MAVTDKEKVMKSVVLTILLCAATVYEPASNRHNTDNTPESIGIEVYYKQTCGTNPQERNQSYYELEALLYNESKMVEVSLLNIGDVCVSIVAANGTLIDSKNVCTDYPATVMLNAESGNGICCLMVSSSAIYAEGWFRLSY